MKLKKLLIASALCSVFFPLNYLCKVIQTVPVRGFEVFFGEIVAAYLEQSCLIDGQVDPLKINPVMGMGATYYDLGQEVGKAFMEGKSYKNSHD